MDTKTLFDFLCLYPPNSLDNRAAGDLAILDVRSLQCKDCSNLLNLTDLFLQLNQPIRKLLKRSAKGQILSIISLVILHDSFSNELPVNFWIHIFWILLLPYKINWWPIHYVLFVIEYFFGNFIF